MDYHLHEFRVVLDSNSGRIGRFGIPVDDMLEQPPLQPDWIVKVSDVLSASDLPILYVYDFGDDWRHIVMYEGGAPLDRSVKYPRCVSGARKCPLEDCGGVGSYMELLTAIRDPQHERHAELLEWLCGNFDPDDFNAKTLRFDDPKKRWKTAFEHSPEALPEPPASGAITLKKSANKRKQRRTPDKAGRR